jgi:hypothetical protein
MIFTFSVYILVLGLIALLLVKVGLLENVSTALLVVGTIGGMLIAMIYRVGLCHTGRPLIAPQANGISIYPVAFRRDAAGDTSRLVSCLQYCQYWIGRRFMGNGICNFLLRLCKKIDLAKTRWNGWINFGDQPKAS